jgi:hypothetical protein
VDNAHRVDGSRVGVRAGDGEHAAPVRTGFDHRTE